MAASFHVTRNVDFSKSEVRGLNPLSRHFVYVRGGWFWSLNLAILCCDPIRNTKRVAADCWIRIFASSSLGIRTTPCFPPSPHPHHLGKHCSVLSFCWFLTFDKQASNWIDLVPIAFEDVISLPAWCGLKPFDLYVQMLFIIIISIITKLGRSDSGFGVDLFSLLA